MRRAHTRKLGAHINVSSKNISAHISYMLIRFRMSIGKLLHKRNFYVHTDIDKLEGPLEDTHYCKIVDILRKIRCQDSIRSVRILYDSHLIVCKILLRSSCIEN